MRRFSASSAALAVALAALACSGPGEQPAAQGEAGGGAPVRDISGVWAGPPLPELEEAPPLTAWGQERFDAMKPTWGPRAVGLGDSNDPLVTCDPLGFPRAMLYETRGFEFLHTPAKTVQLLQYQHVWREIWTDGRALPADVGGTSATSPDPRVYGYSVGRWIDDYTFVVDTVGSDERTWLDYRGYPHSVQARFEERYQRKDRDTLELTFTVTDPVAYTRPFVVMRHAFQRAAKQDLEEQLCIPSDALEYYRRIAAPTSTGTRLPGQP